MEENYLIVWNLVQVTNLIKQNLFVKFLLYSKTKYMKVLRSNLSILSVLICFGNAEIVSEEVYFGKLSLQLNSDSLSESKVLQADIITVTSRFLDGQLKQYFSESISDDYFSHTSLTVNNFTLEKNYDSSFSVIIDCDGSAYFDSVPLPGENFIFNRLKDIFRSTSHLAFITDLQLSDVSFLTDMTHLTIELNHQVIVTEDLTSHQENVSRENFMGKNMAYIIASISSGVIVLIVSIAACVYFRDKKKPKSQLRVKTEVLHQQTDEELDSPVRSPSPEHSICSQESSKFTYNPRSVFTSTSSISGLTMDTKATTSKTATIALDLENGEQLATWTRQNTISPISAAAFGNDISMIEPHGNKDLSLVMEGTDEEKTPASHRSKHSEVIPYVLNDLDNSILNVSWERKKTSRDIQDSFQSDDDAFAYENSDISDIITDLNNLSLQIESHRGKTKSLYGLSED
jgi:hypothetical protein